MVCSKEQPSPARPPSVSTKGPTLFLCPNSAAMARPSKLSKRQWSEIETRLKAGESRRALAREFKVGEATIRAHIVAHLEPLQTIAKQLATAEIAMERLPISAQVKVRNLADDLKEISTHLAAAATYGAMTAHRLSSFAHLESAKIDDTKPLANQEALQGIAILTKMANSSSEIGLNLLAANKERIKELSPLDFHEPVDLSQLSDAELEQARPLLAKLSSPA